MVVVVGIVGLLMSLIMPIMAESRAKARVAWCCSNLRQISQALVMYDTDHDRSLENYPDRLTHLAYLGYVADARAFICPADSTHATKNADGKTTLKPGKAKDDKSYWAERRGAEVGMPTLDCSYLYEFSTRTCQGYIKGASGYYEWTGSGWGSDALVGWWGGDEYYPAADYLYEPTQEYCPSWMSYTTPDGFLGSTDLLVPANPHDVDRDGNGVVTWQEAKFWQLQNGDVYCSAYATPGDMYVPSTWSWDPYDTTPFDHDPLTQYPRTWMPIVRCFWHMPSDRVDDEMLERVNNVSLDGNTFVSVPGWEQTAWHGAVNGVTY
jgi:type II secretory pathway pseudopilin PulG